jgi:hypothetical protein
MASKLALDQMFARDRGVTRLKYAGFRGLRRMVWRRASGIGDGSWERLLHMLVLMCTRIR